MDQPTQRHRGVWCGEKGRQRGLNGWVAGGLWVCNSVWQAGTGTKQRVNG